MDGQYRRAKCKTGRMKATARWRERKSVVNDQVKSIHNELIDHLEKSTPSQVRCRLRIDFDNGILWPVIMVYSPIGEAWRKIHDI